MIMDINAAFYKQKDELHALQRENKKLNKQLEGYVKGCAADEKFQKQLSHIQYLNKQVTHFARESDRYKELYEKSKKTQWHEMKSSQHIRH